MYMGDLGKTKPTYNEINKISAKEKINREWKAQRAEKRAAERAERAANRV